MIAGVQVDGGELLGLVMKLAEYLAHVLVGYLVERGHLHADGLDLLGGEVFEDLGRAILIEG